MRDFKHTTQAADQLLRELRNSWISPEAKAAAAAGDAAEDIRALREEDSLLEQAGFEHCENADGRTPEEVTQDLLKALGLS